MAGIDGRHRRNMHGKLGQQAVTEVDLVILLHVDRRTELRVEAVG